MTKRTLFSLALGALAFSNFGIQAQAASSQPATQADTQLDRGNTAIHSMAGCYNVDYDYAETKSLKPGYTVDSRVYDVTDNQVIKEWIYIDDISPTRFRLQHILFAVDLKGQLVQGSELKHTGEDWEYQPAYIYEFTGPATWKPRDTSAMTGQWVRRITNLDDGLRYQCLGTWDLTTAYPEFSCSSYAPIPGREYRDMHRTDYNTLQRTNRVIVYPQAWLERQNNVKTIDDGTTRTPLAAEVGKDWYTRLPDSECQAARDFIKAPLAFWTVLREAWDKELDGKSNFVEKDIAGQSRYMDLINVEFKYYQSDLSNPMIRSQAAQEITQTIEEYRVQ